jgi:hypothetical protein
MSHELLIFEPERALLQAEIVVKSEKERERKRERGSKRNG